MITGTGPNDPERIGPYRVAGRLGGGVYLGEDGAGRRAAVHLLDEGADPDALPPAARCTPDVLAADPDAAPPYLATAYVPGPRLQPPVRARGPRPGSALGPTALAALHAGVAVHGGLPPGRVILGPDGPRVVGTDPRTAAQGASAQATPAADVFAWAETTAFAALGRSPFSDTEALTVPLRLSGARTDLAGAPEPLRALLEACLNEDPGLRPSAAALVAELLGVEENEPGLLDRGAAAADDPTTPAFPAVPVAAAPVPTLQVPRAEAVE